VASDLNLHVGRERYQRHDCRCRWSYGVWTAVRQRAGEGELRDRLRMIEVEAGEAAKRGLQ
jgi:hypothetical protein